MTFPTVLTNPAQTNAPVVVNANFDAVKPGALFGKRAATTTGLTWGYFGGVMDVDGVLTTVADGTVALTLSATNYVEATRAGAVSTNTTGFTAGRIPLYTLVCSASAVTTETEGRAWVTPDYIAGRVSVAVTTVDVTLSAAQARCDIINVTGALTANRNLILPVGPQTWCVTNNTTGAFTLTVKTAAGAGIAVTQGKAADLLADGTNVILSNNDAAAAGGSLLSANNLSDVANAATARTNLGVDAAITAAVNGLSWKQAVRAKTTAALPANTYANGTAGVGATLTATANGAIAAQDGVTPAANDTLLVTNEAAGANNGIYTVTQVGTAGTPYILTRRSDADAAAELVNASVYVSEGTTLADTQWTCTTNATITVGTTSVAFAQLTSGGGIFDASVTVAGTTSASEKLMRVPLARAVTFPANFAGSYATGGVAATASTPIDIQRNGVSVGTITFAAAGTVATFASSGGTAVNFIAGDVLAIIAPASPDATLADIGITLAGTR